MALLGRCGCFYGMPCFLGSKDRDFTSRLARLPRDRLVQGGGRDSRCDIWGRPVSEKLVYVCGSRSCARQSRASKPANSQSLMNGARHPSDSFPYRWLVHCGGRQTEVRHVFQPLVAKWSTNVKRRSSKSLVEAENCDTQPWSCPVRCCERTVGEKKSCWSQEVGTHRALEIEPRRHWGYRLDGTWGEPRACSRRTRQPQQQREEDHLLLLRIQQEGDVIVRVEVAAHGRKVAGGIDCRAPTLGGQRAASTYTVAHRLGLPPSLQLPKGNWQISRDVAVFTSFSFSVTAGWDGS